MPFCECSHFWPGMVFIAPCASLQVISLFSVKSAIIHFLKVSYLKFKMHFNEQRSRAKIGQYPNPQDPQLHKTILTTLFVPRNLLATVGTSIIDLDWGGTPWPGRRDGWKEGASLTLTPGLLRMQFSSWYLL